MRESLFPAAFLEGGWGKPLFGLQRMVSPGNTPYLWDSREAAQGACPLFIATRCGKARHSDAVTVRLAERTYGAEALNPYISAPFWFFVTSSLILLLILHEICTLSLSIFFFAVDSEVIITQEKDKSGKTSTIAKTEGCANRGLQKCNDYDMLVLKLRNDSTWRILTWHGN